MFNKKLKEENMLLKELVKQQELIIKMYINKEPLPRGIFTDKRLIKLKKEIMEKN